MNTSNKNQHTEEPVRIIVGNVEALVVHYFRNADNATNNSEADSFRSSAYKLIDELLSKTDKQVVVGDADDYHNLAVTFSREDDYETALEIVKKGLKVHKSNTDLLADAIKYGSVCGCYEECDEWMSRLNSITKKKWTWRAFSFSIDYLIDSVDRMENISNEQFEAIKVSGVKLVKEYQEYYSDYEDSWYSEYELYWNLNERKTAKEILVEISKKQMNCPKSWLRYADIMMDDGNLAEAEKMLRRLTKIDVESTSSSYAYYLDGRCQLEKLLNANSLNNKDKKEAIISMIDNAYRSFALAWRLSPSSILQERIRKAVKRLYLESEIKPSPNYNIEDYGIKFDQFE